jgi:hypothetical protein
MQKLPRSAWTAITDAPASRPDRIMQKAVQVSEWSVVRSQLAVNCISNRQNGISTLRRQLHVCGMIKLPFHARSVVYVCNASPHLGIRRFRRDRSTAGGGAGAGLRTTVGVFGGGDGGHGDGEAHGHIRRRATAHDGDADGVRGDRAAVHRGACRCTRPIPPTARKATQDEHLPTVGTNTWLNAPRCTVLRFLAERGDVRGLMGGRRP